MNNEQKMEDIMKERIGETAGNIWSILKERREVDIAQLPRILKDKTVVAYQALGWLAREDKVKYRVKAGKTLVSLTEPEKEK